MSDCRNRFVSAGLSATGALQGELTGVRRLRRHESFSFQLAGKSTRSTGVGLLLSLSPGLRGRRLCLLPPRLCFTTPLSIPTRTLRPSVHFLFPFFPLSSLNASFLRPTLH